MDKINLKHKEGDFYLAINGIEINSVLEYEIKCDAISGKNLTIKIPIDNNSSIDIN